jgi:hypothetical protein
MAIETLYEVSTELNRSRFRENLAVVVIRCIEILLETREILTDIC